MKGLTWLVVLQTIVMSELDVLEMVEESKTSKQLG
jgi:hypothetical protein